MCFSQSVIRFQTEVISLYHLHSVQIGCGAHLISLQWILRAFSLGLDLTTHPPSSAKNEGSSNATPLYAYVSCTGQLLYLYPSDRCQDRV